MNFRETLKEKRLYLDGAMGSLLQNKIKEIGLIPEALNMTHAELIKDIHRSYIKAGANIILANTFGINGYKLKDSDYDVSQMVALAINNLKELSPDFVALDIGPLGALIGSIGDLSFEQAIAYFKEVMAAGQAAGADLVVIETMSDINEARAAVIAAKEVTNLPIIASMTYEENGRTLTGSDPLTVVNILEGLGVDCLGINCSTGPEKMVPIIKELIAYASVPVMVEPNAGLPKMVDGQTRYDLSADAFAHAMADIAKMGAMVLGGCCGTRPDYISKMIAATKDFPIFVPAAQTFTAASSSTKTEVLGRDVLVIGENINPTTNQALKAGLRAGDLTLVADLAVQQKKAGARLLDINLGLPEIDEVVMMQGAVALVSRLVDCPLVIDSSNSQVIEAVIRSYPGKAIINSVNAKASSMAKIFPIAKKYGALVLALTMDESGLPDSADKRLAIAEKMIREAANYGLDKNQLLIDCLVLTASAQQKEVRETLQAVKRIRQVYNIPTVLGVSNISFGLPRRDLLNRTFLTMALQAGLTNPIINPSDAEMMKTIDAFRALWGNDDQCRFYADHYKNKEGVEKKEPVKDQVLDLGTIIEEGLSDKAKAETERLLETQDPLEIVNSFIIPALDAVGDAFETGECFLPHLIFAAETAKEAFEAIKEKMTASGRTQVSRGTIILATVEGDVHDIGKNIVKVVLENYGYTMIDLGKDIKAELILEAIAAEEVKLVGLSALMTTTVRNMETIIKRIKEKYPLTKIMVGGAVLTKDYAMAIGADYYGKDAREGANIAKKVFSN